MGFVTACDNEKMGKHGQEILVSKHTFVSRPTTEVCQCEVYHSAANMKIFCRPTIVFLVVSKLLVIYSLLLSVTLSASGGRLSAYII